MKHQKEKNFSSQKNGMEKMKIEEYIQRFTSNKIVRFLLLVAPILLMQYLASAFNLENIWLVPILIAPVFTLTVRNK